MIAPQVWIDGVSHPIDAPHVSARDRGLTLADGLFETMRARNGRVFRLQRHLARLESGLGALEIPVPAGLRQAVVDAVAAAGAGDASIRLTVTRGPGPPGLAPPAEVRPTVVVTVSPMPEFPAALYRDGVAAHVASGRRNERAMTAGLKTVAYTDAVAALLEARRHGADEALFLDTDGHCSEATASNLFTSRGGALVTPPASCGALPGVTREVVLELSSALGLSAVERVVTLDDVHGADEAFLTSSIRGIAPLVRVDGRPIGSGAPGAVTARLREAYGEIFARECP